MAIFLINLLITITYFIFLWLGNYVCKCLFERFKLTNAINHQNSEENIQTGKIIGFFERILIGLGIMLKSWEIVAGVIALKSISRYRELDIKINAEYFLIGSMISLIWAFVVTFSFYQITQILIEKNFIQSSIFSAIKEF